ncbi:MAG: Uma2 family endonuclease [Janthinobacterium lividum]
MDQAVRHPDSFMTVAEFLAWDPPDNRMWQLVDGTPVAMAPASWWHNSLLGEVHGVIRSHLLDQGSPCMSVPTPGIVTPRHTDRNMRIPDLAVTCADPVNNQADTPKPILVVEILSPSNQAEIWINVWTYTMMPSVQEVIVFHTTSVRADMLRRRDDGTWPDDPERVVDGNPILQSIGLRTPLADLYRVTGLRRQDG